MITILSPDQEFNYEPIDESVKQELTKRESDKNRMIGRVPFLRITCLQKVTNTNIENPNKENQLKETSEKLQLKNKQVDGFVFELGGSFDEAYGVEQVIGKELSTNRKIYIDNPRRVPPPRLSNFTAQNGEAAGFYTTANLQLTVNSKEQLEFLTPFLLHPGNTVFIEFGYSDKNTTMNEELFSYSDLKTFVDSLNIKNTEENDDRVTLEEFYNKQQQKVLDNEGNFEFVVGVIHNFDFKLNKDFGFDVNIDLWSISKTRMGAPDDTIDKGVCVVDKEQELRNYISSKELSETIGGAQSVGYFREGPVPQETGTRPKQNIINITTDKGNKKYVRLGSFVDYITFNFTEELPITSQRIRINPFIVSNNKSIIWFNRKTIDYSLIKKTDFGEFIFTKEEVNFLLENTVSLSDELIDPSTIQVNSRPVKEGGTTRGEYYVDFNTVRPYFINTNDEPFIGDVFNVYIEVEQLIRNYLGNGYNINDTLKSILSDITAASSDVWQLVPISDESGLKIASFSGRKIEEKDRLSTYTFKFNQKQSVTNEISFDLKLEGIIGDQIYFESINQTDSNTSSTKLNLLLFEKHENGIEIYDYRNKALEQLAKDNNIKYPRGEQKDKESTITVEEVVDRIFSNKPEKNLPLLSLNNNITVSGLKDELIGLTPTADEIGVVRAGGSVKEQAESKIRTNTKEVTTIQSTYEPYLVALKQLGVTPVKNDDSNEDETPKLGGVNPLLESSVDITMPGLGGFRPLTFFNTDGLPDVYDKRGDFCIMNVVHSLSPTSWTTSINSRFRIRDKQ